MKIKKGNSFVCIKKVVMNKDLKNVSYKKGFIYYSEIDGCITNDKSNAKHQWPNGTKSKKHFLKLK